MRKNRIRIDGRLYESVDEDSFEDAVDEAIENMDTEDLADLWNAYCSALGREDRQVHPMEDLDDEFSGFTPTKVVNSLSSGFSVDDDYYYHKLDFVESTSDPVYDFIVTDQIASYVIGNMDGLGNEDLEDVIDRFEYDDDE